MVKWFAVVALALTGCSFIVTTLPDGPRKPGNCTGQWGYLVAPAFDAAAVSLIAVKIAEARALEKSDNDAVNGMRALAVDFGALVAVTLGISAIKGVESVSKCRCATARSRYDASHH